MVGFGSLLNEFSLVSNLIMLNLTKKVQTDKQRNYAHVCSRRTPVVQSVHLQKKDSTYYFINS
jgi:hypothetical protein